ncbi:alpha/beta hydrolase [Dyadobacter flavalbus]|uniref:Alpha/beta hydrolase n=1 Tax=Dyadobacter flavalbus TaxID=2579942 RepID=A0A5M8R239_9BACT|nr:alpha/beta hydrolase [Dyadobacter flavalbus]KAA6441044.1 alpha/beta hydrolase [Dyadobacter flavalbus]
MNYSLKVAFILLQLAISSFLLLFSGCSFRRIAVSKNVVYQKADQAQAEHSLNVFAPKKIKTPKNVLVFFHGGNWNSGRKSQYNIFGKHWARKDVVAVIADYPLSPGADFSDMAFAAAKAVKWVKENIGRYGGNPERIFVSGHSAGGHLAALISTDDRYFTKLGISNPIAGTILIDAAGLDMHGYLKEEKFPRGHTYLNTFTSDPEKWKEASPVFHLHPAMPPMLIYSGGRTYPSISKSNLKFVTSIKSYAPETIYRIQKKKKHVAMILQFVNPLNRRYKEIKDFMKSAKNRPENLSKPEK